MSGIIENTAADILRGLEASGIRYAVMRNYEALPTLKRAGDPAGHTDIDLVADSRDLERLRTVLISVAEKHSWDSLGECDHWAQSPVRHHNIEAFHFHSVEPLDYLQVDVFHGYVLWALPLYDESQMLDGRVHDRERGLTRVDPVKENVYRLIQIHGLYPGAERKTARYQARFLEFRKSNREALDRELAARFGRFGVAAADALASNDMNRFMRQMRQGRARFILRYAFRHPFAVLRYFANRLREHVLRFHTRQCGCVLRVSVCDEAQRATVCGVMDDLVQKSFMDEWSQKEPGTSVSKKDRAAMEQGAVIIEWSTHEQADLDLRTAGGSTEIARTILRAAGRQHKPLFAYEATAEGVVAR